MQIRFLGDTHGDYASLSAMDSQTPTVQIGDLNLFGYSHWVYRGGMVPYEFKNKSYFIDGNHDNFPKLNPDADHIYEIVPKLNYIPRGFVSGKVMFIGGGDSPPFDRKNRTSGRDWFPEESLSLKQFEKIMAYEGEIEVIVAHDAPDFVVTEILTASLGTFHDYQLPTPIALAQIFDKFKPKLWIFGHYHSNWEQNIRDCHFICVNIGSSILVDIPVDASHFGGNNEPTV